MKYFERYMSDVQGILEKISQNEEQYADAARQILERIQRDGLIYSFGTGHGHLLALEIFYRAGGLARVCPVLDERLMLHKSATGSSAFEQAEGNAEPLFKEYNIGPSDVFIVFSNSGINPLTIEMTLLAKAAGALTIGITNLNHSRPLKSRASSGQKLYEICDIVFDNFGKLGDATVETDHSGNIAPTSTISGSAILHGLMACVVELAEEQGFPLEVLTSANIPRPANYVHPLEKFKGRIKAL